MKTKFNDFLESFKQDVVHNKKEYILTLAVCILGGLVVGLLFSPKKEVIMGSFNGNNANGCDLLEEDDEEEDD